MIYGNYGKLLRVKLTEKQYNVEEISGSVLKEAIGGKGLGTYLLLREVEPTVDPFSPDNKIIIATGPVSGVNLAASSRYGIFAKSPLTGIYAESYSGGHVAPAIKGTGFDAVVIEGCSDVPVYLHISPEGVSFIDAANLWGLETYEAEKRIRKEAGAGGAQAMVIGPAGENLVRFACIKNNYWRSAGRAGLGAVLGSKKVKGLVFSGSEKVTLADPALLEDYYRKLRRKGKESAGVKAFYQFGTPRLVSVLNGVNSFPTRYWSRGQFEHAGTLSADYMVENMHVRSKACRGCFVACGKLSRVLKGRHAGLKIEGPEYETIYSFGGLCCVEELEEVAYLNDICDRLGIDTISAGNLVAFAMEASARGKIKDRLVYGDADDIARLLFDISARRGLGAVLAEGIRSAARQFDLEDLAVHVKGLEPAGYDPRVLKGMGLAYATSDRGACHLRATIYAAELSGLISPEQVEGKAELFVDWEDRMALFDCLIFCRFYRDLVPWADLSTVIAGSTGYNLTQDQMKGIANRIIGWARRFNLGAGITRRDDTLPEIFFNKPLDEEGKQVITRSELDYMVNEYYNLRKWNSEGIPGDMGIDK